ncbi:MAG: transcriptional repressor [Armatimonadetes bacterium]|nr:transcriptional repressor [Armatimonadota bacterium]
MDELRKVTSHPTADQVYEMARKVMPRISLGTVYRTLDILAERELIRRLRAGGARVRYDGNPEPHYHIRCLSCGRVDDVAFTPDPGLESAARAASDYEITGHHVEFTGLCPECKSRNAHSEKELP